MELIRTMKQFMEIVSQGNTILYGAGKTGKYIYDFLRHRDVSVMAFTVTQLDQEEKVGGVPVYCLDDILKSGMLEKGNLILTVQNTYRIEIEEELSKRGIDTYYCFSDIMRYEFLKEIVNAEAEKTSFRKEHEGQKAVGFFSAKYMGVKRSLDRLILGQIENAAYVPLPWEMPEIDYVDTRLEHDSRAYSQFLQASCSLLRYDLKEIDLIHSFNAVCKTGKPWIASFETTIPRLWPQDEGEKEYYIQLIDWMKKDNCRVLYAMSGNAYNIQRYTLAQYLSSADVDMLMEKTKILYPPQRIIISQDELDRKYSMKRLHFLFVGRAFFMKGGRETIRILSEFADEYDFKLTLVSSLNYGDYMTPTTYEDKLKWKKIIQEKEWIEYYESLPNEIVLQKCREASVGLLPSYGDTFGYSVLEMQAAGCPVITTNLRAFPETNNDDCGWVCRLPVGEVGTCAEWDDEARSRILEQELRRCFQEIFNNPEMIRVKGTKALNRIKEMHDPYKYQMELGKNLE